MRSDHSDHPTPPKSGAGSLRRLGLGGLIVLGLVIIIWLGVRLSETYSIISIVQTFMFMGVLLGSAAGAIWLIWRTWHRNKAVAQYRRENPAAVGLLERVVEVSRGDLVNRAEGSIATPVFSTDSSPESGDNLLPSDAALLHGRLTELEQGAVSFFVLESALSRLTNIDEPPPPLASVPAASATVCPGEPEQIMDKATPETEELDSAAELPDWLSSLTAKQANQYEEVALVLADPPAAATELPTRRNALSRAPAASEATDWLIGMSDTFISSMQKMDKKLMGRILEAMTFICRAPMTLRGDTVKPLTADFKGLWRYRIGDFRLVYKPEKQLRRVTLLVFEDRGGVYQ